MWRTRVSPEPPRAGLRDLPVLQPRGLPQHRSSEGNLSSASISAERHISLPQRAAPSALGALLAASGFRRLSTLGAGGRWSFGSEAPGGSFGTSLPPAAGAPGRWATSLPAPGLTGFKRPAHTPWCRAGSMLLTGCYGAFTFQNLKVKKTRKKHQLLLLGPFPCNSLGYPSCVRCSRVRHRWWRAAYRAGPGFLQTRSEQFHRRPPVALRRLWFYLGGLIRGRAKPAAAALGFTLNFVLFSQNPAEKFASPFVGATTSSHVPE